MESSQNRGIASEAMVEQALEYLKQKPRPNLGPTIKSYIHAAPNSALDKKKTDFLITCEGGICVPLQVKSSKRGKHKFERWCREHGRTIVAVAVEMGDDLGRIIWKVARCIRLFFNIVQREKNIAIAQVRKKLPRLRRRKYCSRYSPLCMCH